jgi:hypothetical protein
MLALGVDHRSAPTSVREALAFDGGRLRRGLEALKDDAPGLEFVLLSTCNRVELYAAATSEGTAVLRSPDDLRRRGAAPSIDHLGIAPAPGRGEGASVRVRSSTGRCRTRKALGRSPLDENRSHPSRRPSGFLCLVAASRSFWAWR